MKSSKKVLLFTFLVAFISFQQTTFAQGRGIIEEDLIGLRTNNGNSKATAVAGISANSQRTNSAGSIIEEDLISLRANNGGISAKDMYYFFFELVVYKC